jgi:hypothetical protein
MSKEKSSVRRIFLLKANYYLRFFAALRFLGAARLTVFFAAFLTVFFAGRRFAAFFAGAFFATRFFAAIGRCWIEIG